MLVLHKFPPVMDLPSPSPACLKLETWLRMNEVPYETAGYSPFQAPKGKAPYVRLPDGTFLGDSHLIIEHLSRDGVEQDAELSDAERGRATAIQRVVEEHLYFAVVYFRWLTPAGFELVQRHYFESFPLPVRWILPHLARRQVRRSLWGQGIGRHSPDEIAHAARADLNALATLLGERPWFLGDTPSSIDATVYGTLANLAFGPFDDDIVQALREHDNLNAFVERLRRQVWTD